MKKIVNIELFIGDKPTLNVIKKEIKEIKNMISNTTDKEKLKWLNECLNKIQNY